MPAEPCGTYVTTVTSVHANLKTTVTPSPLDKPFSLAPCSPHCQYRPTAAGTSFWTSTQTTLTLKASTSNTVPNTNNEQRSLSSLKSSVLLLSCMRHSQDCVRCRGRRLERAGCLVMVHIGTYRIWRHCLGTTSYLLETVFRRLRWVWVRWLQMRILVIFTSENN